MTSWRCKWRRCAKKCHLVALCGEPGLYQSVRGCLHHPFVETIRREGVQQAEAVEQVDIGGPSLIRAAAKNHERVAVVVSPEDYGGLIEALDAGEGALSLGLRQQLAARAPSWDPSHFYSAGFCPPSSPGLRQHQLII